MGIHLSSFLYASTGGQVWCFSIDVLPSHWVLWKKKEENITVGLRGAIALSATVIMVRFAIMFSSLTIAIVRSTDKLLAVGCTLH